MVGASEWILYLRILTAASKTSSGGVTGGFGWVQSSGVFRIP